MVTKGLNKKENGIILSFIVLLGFFLRLQAAAAVPIVWDEAYHDLPVAKTISFSFKNPNLPLIDKEPENSPMAGKYLIRLGWYVFGDSLLGARIPFVIISSVTILFLYLFLKSILGIASALIASFVLAVSQYSIGTSRLADPTNSVCLFFTLISLFIFYKALNDSRKYLFLLNGLIIGIGCWFKENIAFLFPIYVIFLLIYPEYRRFLKEKYFWLSLILTILVTAPLFFLSLLTGVLRYKYMLKESTIGLSLNSCALYLGELILLMLKPFPKLFDFVASTLETEIPPENFFIGLLILVSLVILFKDKRQLIRLMVTCFLFNFLLFSLVRKVYYKEGVNTIWHMGGHDWGNMGIVPGIILSAEVLKNLIMKYGRFGKALFVFFVLAVLIRALVFVQSPIYAYFPAKDFFIRNHCFWFADYLYNRGEKEYAKGVLRGIYNASAGNTEFRKRAGEELSKI